MTCEARLRVGGTVSGDTITGGVSIESEAINLLTWDQVRGLPNRQLGNVVNPNRDGEIPRVGSPSRPGKLWRSKPVTLQVLAWDRDVNGLITSGDGRCDHLEGNLDDVGELLLSAEDLIVLEMDMPDGTTRWMELEFSGVGIPVLQGPVFGSTHAAWSLLVPMIAPYPFWQDSEETDLVVTQAGGSETLSNTGTAPIGNAQVLFAGDSILEHTEYGAELEASGVTTPPLTVDLRGSRVQVTEGGSIVKGKMRRNRAAWMRFPRGNSTLTATGANVTVRYRLQWLI